MAIKRGRDLHSALKTDVIGKVQADGLQVVLIRLQWAKDDSAFSLHVAPNQWSSSGFQLTDTLSYLGFTRQECPFVDSRQAYCDWTSGDIDLARYAEGISKVHGHLLEAQRHLEACGFRLPQPEGYGYFFGKRSESRFRNTSPRADGHTSPKTEVMKNAEDAAFQFVMTWMEGGSDKGWTFHYRPKHPPLSIEVEAAFGILGLARFSDCPQFDFEPCHWTFHEFALRGDSPFDSNAEWVHGYFGAHAQHFSPGLEQLLAAQSTAEQIDRSIFRMPAPPGQRAVQEIERAIVRPAATPSSPTVKKYLFDIAISFAGPQREIAQAIATYVKNAGFAVFYDSFYPEMLWGKNLVEFFDDIYRKQARYCVMLVSPEYRDRMWTQHERRSAQARALEERGGEYILPLVVEPAELPGMPPIVGYLSLAEYPVEKITEILLKKLGSKN
jgi:hypothetical protein